VPIKRSSGKEIDALIADLSADSPVTREAAVARLTIIGDRAVDKLVASVESARAPAARVGALQTLESIASLRALDRTLDAVSDPDPAVASAAVSATQPFLRSARGADVVDRLTQTALDALRPSDVRLTAIDTLAHLTPEALKPLWKVLSQDSDARVRTRAQSAAAGRPTLLVDPVQAVTAAAEGTLPDDPVALAHAIAEAGGTIALPLLHRVVERVAERETAEPPGRRGAWTNTRAAAHLALANRGSRLAVYDLRESLERAADPLPVEFLAALSLVGDASCLEPIGAAYAQAAASSRVHTDWWRQHLATAFHTIVKRERLTRRHAVLKRVQKRWGAVVKDLVR
jgi:HEAT repeat protein